MPRSKPPPPADPGLPDEADALYELLPGEFVAARNALVKQLRASGRKDESAQVAALSRPTRSAWALNQIARNEPDLIGDVLEAGDALRAATEAAMDGDASSLRAATADERAAAGAVTAAASATGDLSSTDVDRMTATLRAAVLDDAVRAQLQRGVLAADHSDSGLGFVGVDVCGSSSTPTAPSKPRLRVVRGGKDSKSDAAAEKERARAEREQAEREREEERARRRRQAELDQAARTARSHADRLAARADQAEEEAARLRQEADEAEAAAREAEAAAESGA
jgi:hypothetical protein